MSELSRHIERAGIKWRVMWLVSIALGVLAPACAAHEEGDATAGGDGSGSFYICPLIVIGLAVAALLTMVVRRSRCASASNRSSGEDSSSGSQDEADTVRVSGELEEVLSSYRTTARAFYIMRVGEQEDLPSAAIDELLDGHERVYARPYLELSGPFRYLGPKFDLVDICLETWLAQHAAGGRREDGDEVAEVVRLLLLEEAEVQARSDVAQWKAAH